MRSEETNDNQILIIMEVLTVNLVVNRARLQTFWVF